MKLFMSMLALLSTVANAQTSISSLPPASTPTGSEAMPIVQGGQTRKVTPAQVVEYANGATGTLTNKTLSAPVINSPTGLVKADVGLGNVDNTSDTTKNAASVTLTNKTLTAPVINSPTGLVKADVGLGNVDNTSDATKNAAVATLTNKTLTSPVINTPTGIVKGDVGLGNVDNTSDVTKNAAAVTLTNKTLTAPAISAGSFTGTNTSTGTEPRWLWQETDAATDKKLWDWDLNGSNLCLRTRTDADAVGQNAICTLRGTTTNLASVTLGNATLGSTLVLDLGGGSLVSDTDFFFLTGQFSVETTTSNIEFSAATDVDFLAGAHISLAATTDVNMTGGGADGDIVITPAGATGSIDMVGPVLSKGTKFTASGCSNGTTIGGRQAGSFVSGTTGVCTVTITFPASVNGWACAASDLTNANAFRQSATSTTSCTVTGSTTSGDVIVFQAMGY